MNRPTHPELTYLAGPYTHHDEKVMEDREIQHSRCGALLMAQGIHVYVPIAETCMIAKHDSVKDTGWDFWRAIDLNKLARCDKMMIIDIDGWKESKGVRGEVKYALLNNIPVSIVSVDASFIIEPAIEQLLEMLNVTKATDLND